LARRRWKNFEDTFIRFDGLHERDGRMDGHTDRQTDRGKGRPCIASRGKKQQDATLAATEEVDSERGQMMKDGATRTIPANMS